MLKKQNKNNGGAFIPTECEHWSDIVFKPFSRRRRNFTSEPLESIACRSSTPQGGRNGAFVGLCARERNGIDRGSVYRFRVQYSSGHWRLRASIRCQQRWMRERGTNSQFENQTSGWVFFGSRRVCTMIFWRPSLVGSRFAGIDGADLFGRTPRPPPATPGGDGPPGGTPVGLPGENSTVSAR